MMTILDTRLPDYGFELVYQGRYPYQTVDFTSYFAAAEAAGTEILVVLTMLSEGVAIVKEYHDRQSPMLFYGGILSNTGVDTVDGWEITEGKCNYVSMFSYPISAEYPLTNQTLPVKDAYFDRWNQLMTSSAAKTYDAVLILVDAIERAGTIETDAVIAALEKTSIETINARNFVFTSSHDTMMGDWNDPEADHLIKMQFQWQNGYLVPIFPKWIMEEAGATYLFPDWPGPWD